MEKSSTIDKDLLVRNITYFIKEQNRKVGEVEDTIGVSQGYLSKISKSTNKQLPSIDTINRLATMFEISIDDLLFTEFPIASRNEKDMREFLETLQEQTKNDEIWWMDENYKDLLYKFSNDERESHPLFDLEEAKQLVDDKTKYNVNYLYRPLLKSLFGGTLTYLYDRCFRIDRQCGDSIYLLKAVNQENFTDNVFYALAVSYQEDCYGGPIEMTEVILTEDEQQGREGPLSLKRLYQLIESCVGAIRLSSKASEFINLYVWEAQEERKRNLIKKSVTEKNGDTTPEEID